MDRRALLGVVAAGIAGAGCTEAFGTPTDRDGCRVAPDRLRVVAVTLTPAQRTQAAIVEYETLDQDVKEVFDAAIDGATVSACQFGSVTAAPERHLDDAINVVSQARIRHRERTDDVPRWAVRTVFLQKAEDFYAIDARDSDMIISSVVDLPSAETTATLTPRTTAPAPESRRDAPR